LVFNSRQRGGKVDLRAHFDSPKDHCRDQLMKIAASVRLLPMKQRHPSELRAPGGMLKNTAVNILQCW